MKSPVRIGHRGWRTALALAALLIVLIGFYLSRLHVSGAHGTLGLVDNLDAPPASWRVVPAPGVDVLVVWSARAEDARFPSFCVRSVLTHTNARGEYSVPGWWQTPAWRLAVDRSAEVYVFKPGYTPLADRSQLPRYKSHSHILGPPAVNPWTGLVLPDEDPLKPVGWRGCQSVERL